MTSIDTAARPWFNKSVQNDWARWRVLEAASEVRVTMLYARTIRKRKGTETFSTNRTFQLRFQLRQTRPRHQTSTLRDYRTIDHGPIRHCWMYPPNPWVFSRPPILTTIHGGYRPLILFHDRKLCTATEAEVLVDSLRLPASEARSTCR